VLIYLACALSGCLFVSQFVWLGLGGRFRLPLRLGFGHVATTFGAPRFRYDVVASSRAGEERVWSLRHCRGRGTRDETATYALISRPDGLYADTALLEHVRRSRPVRDGGDVDGLMDALERGELPGNYELLFPSRLAEGKSWSFGASRVTCLGKRTILTGFGVCRAYVLRIECPEAWGSLTLSLFCVHGLGVPRLTVRIPASQSPFGGERTVDVNITLPGRRAKVVWAFLLFAFSCVALAFVRRLRAAP
jgi:hypothetical protein